LRHSLKFPFAVHARVTFTHPFVFSLRRSHGQTGLDASFRLRQAHGGRSLASRLLAEMLPTDFCLTQCCRCIFAHPQPACSRTHHRLAPGKGKDRFWDLPFHTPRSDAFTLRRALREVFRGGLAELGGSCLLVPKPVRGRSLSTAPETPTLWHLLSPASSSTQGSFHLRVLRSAPYRVTGTERWALERAGQGLASDLRALTKTRRFKPKTPSHLPETLPMLPSPLTARGTRRKYRLLDVCDARRCTCHRLGISTQ